jgi:hypothetical protein
MYILGELVVSSIVSSSYIGEVVSSWAHISSPFLSVFDTNLDLIGGTILC